MSYRLNRRSIERLKALIATGKFNADAGWSFTAEDSNAILGANNWTDYAPWFLGLAEGKADPASDTGVRPEKDWYAYPYGKAGIAHLSALEEIATDPTAVRDIADAAKACLDTARSMIADRAKASSCDLALNFSAPVAIMASIDVGGKPSTPTFSMVAYTGGPLRLTGWKFPVVVDMTGMEDTHKSRPALRDHNQGKVIGHTTMMSCSDGRTLVAKGVMSGHGADRDEVVQTGLSGFPWQASIGARVLANQFVPEGQSASANGQTWEGPINIARRTSLGEISFVALGADDNTSASIAAQAAGASIMKRKFSAWVASFGLIAASLNMDQYNGLLASYKKSEDFDEKDKDAVDIVPPVKAAASDQGDEGFTKNTRAELQKEMRSTAAAETKRIAAVRKVTADFPEIQAQSIEEGWDSDKAELAVLRASRGPEGRDNVSRPFSINTGAGETITPEIVAAAAAISGGVSEKYALVGLSDKAKDIVASSKQLRNMTLRDIMAAAASAQNIPFHGKVNDQFIGKLLNAERNLDIHADGFATMSLTGITENILNKAMLQAYGTVASVVPEICYETDTNDFKTYKRYRLTASGTFDVVGETGDLKSLSLQDESYANQVKTFGVIMTVTRQILINDDMGALTEMPTILGRKAAISREKAVFTSLYSSLATNAPNQSNYFFSAALKNYLSGAASALSITSLTSAVQKMAEMKDANNDPIMIMPDRIIVPPALSAAADNLFQGANIVVGALGSTAAKSTEPNLNAHRNKYRPITSPFMGAQSPISGFTDTNWLLLTNPAGGMGTVQIGYLRGQRVPIIERGEAEFNTLGIAMRCYYDFGTALHDYRCGVWSAGA